ncbi:hypothetical protein KV205_17950 [Streptomyces sp. SKN60]|uniref:hypothetical protein n=1 Tax=Streptomyces sp. SKN60 TaxID=2855506 RepID=UPI00224852B8|nr:hypothetical protein [Streptomyces sp. SKN60]MCX2182400.1 hypothetical protein [Streptomyces sp. SKN60]
MLDTSGDTAPAHVPAPATGPARVPAPGAAPSVPVAEEPRGCLFALSQPPLMIFLAVIGALLLMAAVHDLFLL